jgi:hypothetical protein
MKGKHEEWKKEVQTEMETESETENKLLKEADVNNRLNNVKN